MFVRKSKNIPSKRERERERERESRIPVNLNFNTPFIPRFRASAAFTLIELLIVIAILAILATVTLLVINPAQMIKQSRDSTRLSDMVTIVKAVELYQSSGVNESALGNTNTIYISVPAVNSNCSDLNLPIPLSGWSYACSTSANYTKTDGTGWIPVNFSSIVYGSPLSSLPIDPINATSTGLYYTYIRGSIAVSTGLESEKYLTSSAITDGGYSYYRYEKGTDLAVNAYIPNCGGLPITDIDGNIYNTVQIGKQCWTQTNMMTTHYPDGTDITRGPTTSGGLWNGSDNGFYAYPPDTTNTVEETLPNIITNKLGFVYQWSAAMHQSTTVGAQGICPTGWHIPTDAEQNTLDQYLTDTGQTCNAARSGAWDCSAAGTKLKSGGTSGFNGVLAGYRGTTGGFGGRSSYTYIWSSVESGGGAWGRDLYSGYATVGRGTGSKAYGFSVRCLKN